MKKFLLATVCLALALSSCVKNFESESVVAMQEALADKLRSEAALNEATAKSLELLSAADAAIKAAQAEAIAVETAIREVQKQLLEVELEAAKAELEVLLAELEAKKAKIAADVELAKVEAEKALVEAQEALANAKAQYLETLEGLEAYKAAKLAALFTKYSEAMAELIQAKQALVVAKGDLVTMENGLADAEKLLAEQVAAWEQEILDAQFAIAEAEAYIANYAEYLEYTTEELKPLLSEAEVALNAVTLAYQEVATAYGEASQAFYAMDYHFNPFYVAINGLDYVDQDGNHIVEASLIDKLYLDAVQVIDNIAWIGYVEYSDETDVLNPNGVKTFYPIFALPYYYTSEFSDLWWTDFEVECEYPIYGEPVEIEYVNEDYEISGTYTVGQLNKLGEYNAENLARYIEYYTKQKEDYLGGSSEQLTYFKASADASKLLLDAAYAWSNAQNDYRNWERSLSFDPWGDPTAPGNALENAREAYNNAVAAEAAAKAESEEYNTEKTGLVAVYTALLADVEKAEETAKKAYDAAKAAYEKDVTNEANKAAYLDAKTVYEQAQLDTMYAEYELNTIKAEAKAAADAYAAAQKATKEAEKALRAAEDAVFALEKEGLKYLEAVDAAMNAYVALAIEINSDPAYMFNVNYVFATYDGPDYDSYPENPDLLTLVDEYTAGYTYDYWLETYEYNLKNYEDTVKYLGLMAEMVENQFANIAVAEEALVYLPELEKEAAAFVEEYNAAAKALVEEYFFPYLDASYDYEFANMLVSLIQDMIYDAANIEAYIANYEAQIEAANDTIAELETAIEQSNVLGAEYGVEAAKLSVALAEKKVETCQLLVDIAEAALKAAQDELAAE